MEYEKNISNVEAKYYLKKEQNVWKIENNDVTQQSSYNLPSDFLKYCKGRDILVEDENFIHSRYDKDGNAYVLNSEYKFKLGKGVLWIIGKEFSENNNKFFGSINSKNKKFQLYRAAYNSKKKEENHAYRWFVELYDRNLSGNKLIFKIDEVSKVLEIDVALDLGDEQEEVVELDNELIKSFSKNRIIFGAPGTGKSYCLERDRKFFGEAYERVTFHPNYSYGQFVGSYKPVSDKDKNGNSIIKYEYIPGPFMRLLVKAMKSKKEASNEAYLLLIEEINRANVASVFGDIFQLLDRNSTGESEYEIETSEEMRRYIQKELSGDKSEYKKIKIPNNMYIWATMNSADQGVFPMDTAFKRRWDFEYMDIDTNEVEIENIRVELGKDKHVVKWNDLRKEINDILLKDYNINEDKLLGPYFISKSILKVDSDGKIVDNERFIKTFKNKVIMYLFEDAIGRQNRNRFFKECGECITYSNICKKFDEIGEGIFGIKLAMKKENYDSSEE